MRMILSALGTEGGIEKMRLALCPRINTGQLDSKEDLILLGKSYLVYYDRRSFSLYWFIKA